MAQLLITGGAGFIGSHTCLALLEAGHSLVVIDNYSNSSPESLKRVADLACIREKDRLHLFKGDICNEDDLDEAFSFGGKAIDAVVHFAGLKAVDESILHPLHYWDVNVIGSLRLLDAMHRHQCHTIVFSSSATLYGHPDQVPIPETSRVQPINPYGHCKAAVEQILSDLAASNSSWRIACLRYFNPVGSHPSGLIGEAPNGIPNNLFPFVSQVAVGQRAELEVFGGDWPTMDGSAVRDYIHVMDLAEGHLLALEVLLREAPQLIALNLGSGKGHSVLEVINSFEKASGREVPYRIGPRRPGDVACSVADSGLAEKLLGWTTTRSLEDMCRDSWNWQQANPYGYINSNL